MAYTLCVLYLFSIQDIKTRIVPLKWVILSLFGSLVLRFLYSPNPFSEYIISSLSVGIFLWILSILSNRGMGGGDIQLVAWLGLTVGFLRQRSFLLFQIC
ncbi:prepilin peptidase [Paenibacillus farraposensis]|uniref:prepilin peptidase n=1 Tax=Paenibacillus farraposensis TaxID=2807095 RepID=UPI00361E0A43